MKKAKILIAIFLLIGGGFFFWKNLTREKSPEFFSKWVGKKFLKFDKNFRVKNLTDFAARLKFKNGDRPNKNDLQNGFYYSQIDETGAEFFPPVKIFWQKNKRNSEVLQRAIFLIGNSEKRKINKISVENLPKKISEPAKILNEITKNPGNFQQKFSELQKKFDDKKIKSQEMSNLSFLHEMAGNYKMAQKIDEKNCRENKIRCEKKSEIRVSGKILDEKNQPIAGAEIEILNFPGEIFESDKNGKYDFLLKTKAPQKIRLRVKKQGFGNGFANFYVLIEGTGSRAIDFILSAAHGKVEIDFSKKEKKSAGILKNLMAAAEDFSATATGGVRNFEMDDTNQKIILETEKNGELQSTYFIPYDSIRDDCNRKYNGKVSIEVFEYGNEDSNQIANLLQNDIKEDSEAGIALLNERYMLTVGMPRIKFYAENGNELFVYRQGQMMEVKTKIKNLAALKAGLNGMEPLTDAQINLAINGGADKLDNFPKWFVLSDDTGVWDFLNFEVEKIGADIFIIGDFYTKNTHSGLNCEQ